MVIHYRYSVVIGTSEGAKRIPRLACGWVHRDSPMLRDSVIDPDGVTCKRCLATGTVKHHAALAVLGLRVYPERLVQG